MCKTFADGSVLYSNEECCLFNDVIDQAFLVDAKYRALKKEHDLLKGLHSYAILCRDSFEKENTLLKRQIKADQYAQIFKINQDMKLLTL